MLSVLIINSEIYDRYSRYAYFFNWFEDHKDIAVCFWNKSDSGSIDSIDAMIPQLMDIVKNVPQWNAYVVDAPYDSMRYIEDDFANLTQYAINPYERARDAEYDVEQDSLMQLIYFLGGRGVEKLPYIERFRFRAIRPTNIFLITPRIFEGLEMQKNFLQWKIRNETQPDHDDANAALTGEDLRFMQYSAFWDRYQYPPNCRFVVCDLPNEKNQSYDDAWFTLWLSVVSLMLNTFQSAELGPYKLYTVNALLSDEGFSEFLNKFYTMLLDAKDAVDKEIDNEVLTLKEEMNDTTGGDIVDVEPVYVNLPEVNLDSLYATSEEFGLTKDRPRIDEEVWRDFIKNSKDSENRLFKAVERGKNEAVDNLNRTFKVDLPALKRRQITQYNAEDMIESMNEKELEMISLDTGYKASRTEFVRKQREASEEVNKYLKKRLRFKPALLITLFATMVYLVGFVPYLIHSAERNITSLVVGIVITLLSCTVVGLSGFLALKWLSSRLKKKINEYNEVMQWNVASVTEGAKIQSEYLSDLLDYMEKYQLVTNARVDRRRIEKLDRLNLSSQRFENALDQCSAIARLRHLSLAKLPDGKITETLSADPDVPIYLYEDVEGIKMPLNNVKNALDVPFPFMSGLELLTEDLYDCAAYPTDPVTDIEAQPKTAVPADPKEVS